MKTSKDYIALCKRKLNIESDYALGKMLGLSRFTMSNYKTNRRVIDDYTAAHIAEILDIPAIEVIAAANAEREKDITKKKWWNDFYKRHANSTASITCFLLTLPIIKTITTALTVYYVKCRKLFFNQRKILERRTINCNDPPFTDRRIFNRRFSDGLSTT